MAFIVYRKFDIFVLQTELREKRLTKFIIVLLVSSLDISIVRICDAMRRNTLHCSVQQPLLWSAQVSIASNFFRRFCVHEITTDIPFEWNSQNFQFLWPHTTCTPTTAAVVYRKISHNCRCNNRTSFNTYNLTCKCHFLGKEILFP